MLRWVGTRAFGKRAGNRKVNESNRPQGTMLVRYAASSSLLSAAVGWNRADDARVVKVRAFGHLGVIQVRCMRRVVVIRVLLWVGKGLQG